MENGVVIYNGDKPDPNRKPVVTGIMATGRFWKEKYGIGGTDDNGRYFWSGNRFWRVK